jgi:hypothetical protein
MLQSVSILQAAAVATKLAAVLVDPWLCWLVQQGKRYKVGSPVNLLISESAGFFILPVPSQLSLSSLAVASSAGLR